MVKCRPAEQLKSCYFIFLSLLLCSILIQLLLATSISKVRDVVYIFPWPHWGKKDLLVNRKLNLLYLSVSRPFIHYKKKKAPLAVIPILTLWTPKFRQFQVPVRASPINWSVVTLRHHVTTLVSCHSSNNFLFRHNDHGVNSRTTLFMLQSNPPGMCACMYLSGHTAVPCRMTSHWVAANVEPG